MKNKYWIAILVASILISFFVGRYSYDGKEAIKYVPGETITGSVPKEELTPVKEEKGESSDLPTKKIEIQYRDTGSITTITEIKYTVQVVDTAAIIADYLVKRTYERTLFNNDKQGKLIVYPVVYQNRLTALDYSFTPMHKEITKPQLKVWQPFVSASYSTLDYFGLGGGMFYHDLGFEYQYQIGYKNTNNGHSFGLKYKF